jgi:hypothetical protein
MSDMENVAVTGPSPVDAKDGFVVPRDFPCDIAFTWLGTESAVTNRVDFFSLRLKWMGRRLSAKNSSWPYLKARREKSMNTAIKAR